MKLRYRILHLLWKLYLLKKIAVFKFISFFYCLIILKFIKRDFSTLPISLKYDILEVMSYFKVKSCRNLINNFKIEDFMETRGIDLLIEMQMYVAAEQALVNTFNFRKNWNIKTFNTKYLKLDVGNTQEVNNFKVQYVYNRDT